MRRVHVGRDFHEFQIRSSSASTSTIHQSQRLHEYNSPNFKMKLITGIGAALFFTGGLGLQSKPFNLILHSDNSTLDGKALLSGHEGAAIEGLLPYDLKDTHSGSAVYGFNSTSTQPNYGILTWVLPANGGSLLGKLNQSYTEILCIVNTHIFQSLKAWTSTRNRLRT